MVTDGDGITPLSKKVDENTNLPTRGGAGGGRAPTVPVLSNSHPYFGVIFLKALGIWEAICLQVWVEGKTYGEGGKPLILTNRENVKLIPVVWGFDK